VRALGLLLATALSGCASLPTLSERPEEYHLYRAARVAPTEEQRLRAAHLYVRQYPRGPHRKQLERWFVRAEEEYYLRAFRRLPELYAYAEALPDGPHIGEVKARIAAIHAQRRRKSEHAELEDRKIAATQERLAEADAARRAFVSTFKDWTARLAKIQSFGQPTSELDHETIFAFRLSQPAGVCQGESCRKVLELEYEVPGERELVSRAAVLEVQLELESGLLRRVRVGGPELWTRLAEALSLQPLPTPSLEQRKDAVNRAALLVRGALEPVLPAAECDRPAEPPAVLERTCRGLSARMSAGQNAAEDDFVEIEPAPKAP
jgi:hypothetical protein